MKSAGGARSKTLADVMASLGARGLGDYVKVDLGIVRGLAYCGRA